MNRKNLIRLTALLLALLMPVTTAVTALGSAPSQDAADGSSYDSPDINALMGAGEEPEEISVSAGATYQEKAWYEYVMYSEHAVSSYRLNDSARILFYDPYTYTNSMIMDVRFDATTTEFDTMSSYTISKTLEKTISSCVESTYTSTTANQTSGKDETGSTVKNSGNTITNYNHSIDNETTGTVKNETNYQYKKEDISSWTLTESLTTGSQTSASLDVTAVGIPGGSVTETVSIDGTVTNSNTWGSTFLTDKVTNNTIYSDDYKTTTKYVGDDTVEYNTESVTEGWTQLSARVTKTIGSSSSTSSSWSETESTTVSKTYAATHFASDGATPLPWAIVHYRVQMPLKCCLQIKHSGEWVTISMVYCLLTTVQGTCRAWMQNGQVYYEDWGNGEPVVATDFWSQFMTVDQLINAYQDKLYPEGGVG